MTNAVLVCLVVIACPLLWIMMIVPAIGRLFGVPIRFWSLPIHKQEDRLSNAQSLWFGGLLGWGVGLCLLGGLIQGFVDQKRSTFFNLLLAVACSVIIGAVASRLNWTYPLNRD
jgi:hypothetical protein